MSEKNKDSTEIEVMIETKDLVDTFISEIKRLYILPLEKIEVLHEKMLDKTDVPLELIVKECGNFSDGEIEELNRQWMKITAKWIVWYSERIEYKNKGVMFVEHRDSDINYLTTSYKNYYKEFFDELRGRKKEDGTRDDRTRVLIETYENELACFEAKNIKFNLIHLGNAWWIRAEKCCGFTIDEIIDLEEKREIHIIRKLKEYRYKEKIKRKYEELKNNKELSKLIDLMNLVPELQDLETKMKCHGLIEHKEAPSALAFNML